MTWGDAMKDIKEKPTAHMPRSNATGEIPKAALKKAWAEAKEKSRTMLRESTSTQGDGDYTTAQDPDKSILKFVSQLLFMTQEYSGRALFSAAPSHRRMG